MSAKETVTAAHALPPTSEPVGHAGRLRTREAKPIGVNGKDSVLPDPFSAQIDSTSSLAIWARPDLNEPLFMKLIELRRSLEPLQKQLLEQIAAAHLTNGQGLSTTVLHSRVGKRRTIKALCGLGGTIVRETDARAGITYYEPSFLGLLLSPKAKQYEHILVRCLRYEESIYRKKPEQTKIARDEVECQLGLTPEKLDWLYWLLMSGNLHNGAKTTTATGWEIGILKQVDDLPSWSSKLEFIHDWAMKLYDPNAPVFYPERVSYSPQR